MKYIIKIHSFIDLITNSSTELFIVDENKLEGEVKEICKKLFEFIDRDFYWDNNFEAYVFSKEDEDQNWVKEILERSELSTDEKYLCFEISTHQKALISIIENHFKPIFKQYE